jgi:hypothetical protein
VFHVKWGEKVVAVSDRGFQIVTDGCHDAELSPRGERLFSCSEKAMFTPLKVEAFRGRLRN